MLVFFERCVFETIDRRLEKLARTILLGVVQFVVLKEDVLIEMRKPLI